MINGSHGTLANHSRPDQLINVLDRLDLRLNNTHPPLRYPAAPRSSMGSAIYNTVILAAGETSEVILAAYPQLKPEHIKASLEYAAGLAADEIVLAIQ